MKISVVTPCFRGNEWLKLCIASVADQEGVEVEHIVHDAGSDDGTLDWLPNDSRVTTYVEKDNGMYDAINRGWKKSTGEILCYLNCDEQYLPGALRAVHDTFEARPDVDIVVADTVVTDANGDYTCHRYGLSPTPHLVRLRYSVMTCALFLRRRVLTEHGAWFDTRWRDVGDLAWVIDTCHKGLKYHELRQKVSIFTDTGENMNLRPNGVREHREIREQNPVWLRALGPIALWHQRLRLVQAGAFDKTPYDYALYTKESPDRRVTRHVDKPTGVWVGRSTLPVAFR